MNQLVVDSSRKCVSLGHLEDGRCHADEFSLSWDYVYDHVIEHDPGWPPRCRYCGRFMSYHWHDDSSTSKEHNK